MASSPGEIPTWTPRPEDLTLTALPTATSTPTLVETAPITPTPKTVATGRDRISRWIRIELPSQSGVEGWITTETDYTQFYGDVSNLPFIETEPASPAFIRNCTKHEILILPAEVYLLSKYNKPYNEERFDVGVYQGL